MLLVSVCVPFSTWNCSIYPQTVYLGISALLHQGKCPFAAFANVHSVRWCLGIAQFVCLIIRLTTLLCSLLCLCFFCYACSMCNDVNFKPIWCCGWAFLLVIVLIVAFWCFCGIDGSRAGQLILQLSGFEQRVMLYIKLCIGFRDVNITVILHTTHSQLFSCNSGFMETKHSIFATLYLPFLHWYVVGLWWWLPL